MILCYSHVMLRLHIRVGPLSLIPVISSASGGGAGHGWAQPEAVDSVHLNLSLGTVSGRQPSIPCIIFCSRSNCNIAWYKPILLSSRVILPGESTHRYFAGLDGRQERPRALLRRGERQREGQLCQQVSQVSVTASLLFLLIFALWSHFLIIDVCPLP